MTKSSSQSYSKLGLAAISLLAIIGACSAAASILSSAGGTGGGDLAGFGDDTSQKACIDAAVTNITTVRPVDVIFVVDDSGSMTEELDAISKNINKHFASVMADAGLDYRVIIIVKHGPQSIYGYNNICIEAPLSTIPVGECEKLPSNTPPGNNPGKFYHYSYDVQSTDSLCIILNTLNSANSYVDEFGLAPFGWIKWLRKSAFKILIEVTDDMADCTWYPDDSLMPKGKKTFNDYNASIGGMITAIEFDKALLKLAPEQFGTKDKRNYAFYSIVGMMEKPEAVDDDTGLSIDPNGTVTDLFSPGEGIVSDVCSSAVNSGMGYQWLSKMTGGLRFPVCQAASFDVVFEKIALSIDSIASVVCVLDMPVNGVEGQVDVTTVQVEIETIDGELQTLHSVSDQSACSAAINEFYYDKNANTVVLCPDTCIESKSVSKEIKITAGCIPIIE
jgi:hypothetical protein